MQHPLFISTDEFIGRLLPAEDNALLATEQSVAATQHENMSVSPNQGRFLHVLARLCHPTKILEMGTFVGYSTIWLARALEAGGRLVSLEYDPAHAAIAKDNVHRARLANQVEIRTGKALDLLPDLEREGLAPFDLIFIDADKPPYPEYFQWALRLSRPGTLIVLDNVVKHAVDPDTPADKAAGVLRFLESLKELELAAKVTASVIQNVGIKDHDGMALVIVN